MKLVLAATLALLLVSSSAHADNGKLVAGAVVTAPAAGAELVTSGVLDTVAMFGMGACDSGFTMWHINVFVASNIGTFVKIQIFNADGTTLTYNPVFRGVAANDTKDWMPQIAYPVPNGGKINVVANSALTGTQALQATLLFAPIGCQ